MFIDLDFNHFNINYVCSNQSVFVISGSLWGLRIARHEFFAVCKSYKTKPIVMLMGFLFCK